MDRVIGDDVSTADVLWYAAERIGKSSNGDEIQKICDYLVNKHWFQTAGELRMAQLATEEWHSLQIPSRLKIAMQQVLDEVHYYQQQEPLQGGSPYGYASYYTASAQGEEQQQATWPIDQGYEGHYYSQEVSVSTAKAEQYAQEEYCDMADEVVNGASYDYGCAEPTTAEDTTDHVTSEDYYNYHQHHYAQNAYAEDDLNKVVEAHAVVVEEATTYEEILAPIPIQQWGCRQCTYLNPISESFCEMCHDHISASPDMAGISFPGAPATVMATPKQIAPYSASSERAGYAPPPAYEYVAVTPPPLPMSPLYSPSAPSYDEAIECGDVDESLPQAVLLPPTPIIAARPRVSRGSTSSIPSELAKQLAFQSAGETNAASDCEIIHPTKVVVYQPPPPPPQPAENYFALAFKGKVAGAAAGSSSSQGGTGAAAKSDHVRREEGTLTEYSF